MWIKACYEFFKESDMTYWYAGVSQEQAVAEIMKNSGGRLDPMWVRKKVKELYESVGVK